MKHDHLHRLVLPILIPIGILLAMGAFIGAIAFSLLYNTHEGSLMLAAVVAGGILFTVGLAASRDRLDAPRRVVVLGAAALPLLVGLGLATGVLPGIADEDRMVNVEPLVIFPDGAPVIAAENDQEFCLPADGTCEPVELWEVQPSPESDQVAFVFDNLDTAIPHNVVITNLEGTVDDPERGGETFVQSELITGPAADQHIEPDLTWDELPDEWYFVCAVHPDMEGVGTVVREDA